MSKAFGSGNFGSWFSDEAGLPAFRYTCDETTDPAAITNVGPGLLSSTDHIHQVGNDRLTAIASNAGWVQVRQDEGSPKLLNGYSPERSQFGGGIGYLTDGVTILSTFHDGGGRPFERTFGAGYFRKTTANASWSVDQTIFAPFGDDPVLMSQTIITNDGNEPADLRWVEYWGCHNYQLSFKLYMLANATKTPVSDLRHAFGDRFSHAFSKLEGNAGLLETKAFLGAVAEHDLAWEALKPELAANPTMFAGGAVSEPGDERVSFDDLAPPPTFLASLDSPADGLATNGAKMYGVGGVAHPASLACDDDSGTRGPTAGMFVERHLSLQPGESRTLHFLYGYVPEGFDAEALVAKYRSLRESAFTTSCAQWKAHVPTFDVADAPWIARETAWNYYYVRSNRTYDSYFNDHIISQGAQYTYVMGNQSSLRDPLQHAMPLLFTDPDILKEVIRYNVKSIRADGSLPYGVVGSGMPMPTVMDDASDLPLWLLWAAADYVLGSRDAAFLDEQVPTYPLYRTNAETATVRDLLARSYRFLVGKVGYGEHGLIRMLQDDWNDAVLTLWVPAEHRAECVADGESIPNSAMAAFVFEHYARMLRFAGDMSDVADQAFGQAQANRDAVHAQWTGEWFRRAWLGSATGWLGEKNLWLEPQPWAIIGGCTTPERTQTLVNAIDRVLRQSSPIGAMQQAGAGETMASGGGRPSGMSVNGGIWPSLNATLVWALAAHDPAMAWDEWKKNSLAMHAETYPDVWYATWSGLDSVNSSLNERPGRGSFSSVFNQEDFPVMNMHSHACALFGIPKLLGVEFTESGVRIAPGLPLETYRYETALLGIVQTADGYEGWYTPVVAGEWTIDLQLPDGETVRSATVNGEAVSIEGGPGHVRLTGTGGADAPLRWSIARR